MLYTVTSLVLPFPAPHRRPGPLAPVQVSVWLLLQAGKRSRWRIEPSRGVIPPETEVSVTVIANLDDTEKLKDELTVFIENSHSYMVPVQAVGIGTTIVTDRPFAPELNLGAHFR